MKRGTSFSLWALLILGATANAQQTPCPCDFRIETKGIPANEELRLSAFQINGLKRRRALEFSAMTDLRSGMVIDTTQKWFREHVPCGIDKTCLVRVTYSHKHFGEDALGSVAIIMEMKKRKN